MESFDEKHLKENKVGLALYQFFAVTKSLFKHIFNVNVNGAIHCPCVYMHLANTNKKVSIYKHNVPHIGFI